MRRVVWAALVLGWLGAFACDAAADVSTFKADLDALMRAPHRLSGTPEARAAAGHIADRLRGMGIETLEVPMGVAQMAVRRCELTIGQKTVRLWPARPNVTVLPTTPEGGLSGPVIYAGRGTPDAYRTHDPNGAIVVLEYDCGRRWRDAFRMGAQAVIFLGSEDEQARAPKHLPIPGNVVRLYADADAQAALDLRRNHPRGTVVSHVVWELAEGMNVVGFLPGTDPVVRPRTGDRSEAIVLSSHYDTYGAIPHRSPGARGAANVAALLRMAERLRDERPRRHVLLAFPDNHANQRQGLRVLYAALETEPRDLAKLASQRLAEHEYLVESIALLDGGDWIDRALASESPVFAELKEQADFLAADIDARELELRLLADRARGAGGAELEALLERESHIDNLRRALAYAAAGRRSGGATWIDRDKGTAWLGRHDEAVAAAGAAGAPGRAASLRAEQAILDQLRLKLLDIYRKRLVELERDIELSAFTDALRERLGGATTALHVTYNLSDGGPRWGLVPGDTTEHWRTGGAHNLDSPGHYTGVLRAVRSAIEAPGEPLDLSLFAERTARDPMDGRRFVSGIYVNGGAVAGMHGVYNLAVMTGSDARVRDGHASDTIANLGWRRIAAQAAQADALVRRLADSPALSGDRKFQTAHHTNHMQWDAERSIGTGHFVGVRVTGSLNEDRPARRAIVGVWPSVGGLWSAIETALPANFSPVAIQSSNMRGYVDLVGVPSPPKHKLAMLGTLHDAVGDVRAMTNQQTLEQERTGNYRAELALGRNYTVFYPLLGQSNQTKYPFRVLGAVTNSALRANESLISETDGVGAAFVSDRAIRGGASGLKVFADRGPALLGLDVLTASDAALRATIRGGGVPEAFFTLEDGNLPDRELVEVRRRVRDMIGAGVRPERLRTPPSVADPTADNLWQLNETRLLTMQRGGIPNPALQRLHYRAQRDLEQAESLDAVAPQKAAYAAAAARERRIYQPIRSTMNDLVRAIVVLLVLTIPFAIALERLLIGATTVYGRIGGFTVLFALTFTALYLLHPGFRIATTPVIILLAFVIILLSGMVTYIIIRKFNTELHAMQGQGSQVHTLQMSRIGTLVAAANMGISSMRRRPLRTGLTALTVMLLAFTMLCFASVGSQPGVASMYLGATGEAEADLLIRNPDYSELADDVVDVVRGRQGTGWLVAEQWWLTRDVGEPALPPISVTRADDGRTQVVASVMGVAPAELPRWAGLAEALGVDAGASEPLGPRDVLLPPVIRDQLDLAVGDAVRVDGHVARFAGVLDTNALQLLKSIDNSSALPVDFEDPSVVETREEMAEMDAEAMADVQRAYDRLSPNQIAVASNALVERAGGSLRTVRVYISGEQTPTEVGRDLAEVLPMPVWARGPGGSERLLFTSMITVEAGSELIIPLLLGGLIVFGTMLGSITDREGEIYTFSALGLAPHHVGLLFFAEAVVYAVVGGMGGQLLAQLLAVATAAMGRAGWITPPELNFSSTNALFAIFVVMATVLVSAIIPARRASQSANPGLIRKWKLPRPDGDVMRTLFPFTVSAYDITGVMSYLAEHFRDHDDAGIGKFAARDVAIDRDAQGQLRLSAELALAPFDLGVTQRFELAAAPSSIPGVDEVGIACHRLSGANGDWHRTNKVFIENLRKQFLLWRTLSSEAIESYRARTLMELGERDAAALDPANAEDVATGGGVGA